MLVIVCVLSLVFSSVFCLSAVSALLSLRGSLRNPTIAMLFSPLLPQENMPQEAGGMTVLLDRGRRWGAVSLVWVGESTFPQPPRQSRDAGGHFREACRQEQQQSERENSQTCDSSIQFLVQVMNFYRVLTAGPSGFEKGEAGQPRCLNVSSVNIKGKK